MSEEKQNSKLAHLPWWTVKVLDLPWIEIFGELWKYSRKVYRGMANEGMYEVLEYETTLELHDTTGKKATLNKREKVRYLQDNIIAYQDQAWGDGEILVNYRCTPGIPVDRYRSGYKTHILISLREVRNKGNIDEFNIARVIRRGFLRPDGFWATEINHLTKHIRVNVIFPKTRPPNRTNLLVKNRQRSHKLGDKSTKRLPDGRWQITWEKSKPRLHEQYILKWDW